ncbi:MAG: hypothetical protein HC884_10165 [Chloroflexaceae bacterium]|nr:hypothetical protein [Chloroflexaceae bacterium]
MKHPIRSLSLIAAAAISLLLIGVLTLVPVRTQAGDFTLEPVQPSVSAGQRITFVATNFLPHERVSTWATTPTQAVIRGAYAEANRDGNLSFSFEVPHDAVGGRWAMTVRGDESKVPVVTLFEVYGRSPDAADFQAKVAPEAGPPGTTFAFAATGFDSDEKVSYWVTAPDGEVYDSRHRAESPNKHGRIDFKWQSPPDAMLGTWVMTMQGYDSGVARAIPFRIQGWGSQAPQEPPAGMPAAGASTDLSSPTPLPQPAGDSSNPPAVLPTYEPFPGLE